MGTVLTIDVMEECDPCALDHAFGWFYEIEERCARGDAGSELMQLCSRAAEAVVVCPDPARSNSLRQTPIITPTLEQHQMQGFRHAP
jgi:hypothetical protein